MARRRSNPRFIGRLRRTIVFVALGLALLPAVILLVYKVVPPPVTPLMLIRLVEGVGRDYRWVPLEAMAPSLIAAVVAAEDNLFCRHHGFDVDAIADEMDDWLAGERPRGASTITQQTAKNLFLWPGRDVVRKGLESALTPQLELILSKRRILEIYLNVIEMGPGVYGADAAARRFFGKPAAALTGREAALIAAVLPNPRMRSPGRPSASVVRRAQRIAARSEEMGDLLDCLGGRSGRR